LPEIARYGCTGPTLILVGRAFAEALAASERAALAQYPRARALQRWTISSKTRYNSSF